MAPRRVLVVLLSAAALSGGLWAARRRPTPCQQLEDACPSGDCVWSWSAARTGDAWCRTRKLPGSRVTADEGCDGYDAISLAGEDGGVTFYYDRARGSLVGARGFGMGHAACFGVPPPGGTRCATARELCNLRDHEGP